LDRYCTCLSEQEDRLLKYLQVDHPESHENQRLMLFLLLRLHS
jgi:hypothetical protein